jgi:hypothetical protein
MPTAGRAPHQRGLPRGNAAREQERAPGDAQANAPTIPERAKSLASHTSPAPLGTTPASPARAVTVVNAQFVAGKDDTQQRHSLRDTHPRYAPALRSLATVAYRRFRSVVEPAAPSGLLLWATSNTLAGRSSQSQLGSANERALGRVPKACSASGRPEPSDLLDFHDLFAESSLVAAQVRLALAMGAG